MVITNSPWNYIDGGHLRQHKMHTASQMDVIIIYH